MSYTRIQPTVPCNRCGVVREIKPSRKSTGLCRDCIGALSKEERTVWAA